MSPLIQYGWKIFGEMKLLQQVERRTQKKNTTENLVEKLRIDIPTYLFWLDPVRILMKQYIIV